MALLFGINQSCNTEDQAIEPQSLIETVAKSDAISFVKNFNDSPKTTAKISGAQNQFEFDKVTQEKLTNTSELLTVIPMKTKAHNQRSRALFLRVGTQIESMVYHEFSDDSFTHNTFSGIVLMNRLNGEFIRAYRLKNNEYVIDLVPSKKAKFNQRTTAEGDEIDYELALGEVNVNRRFKISYGFVSLTNLANEVPISINWDPNYNGGGGTSGGFSVTVVEEEDFEDKIDDRELDPCLKGIMDELKNSTNNDITAILRKLGASNEYNLTMKMGTVGVGNYAETIKVSKNNYLTTFTQDTYTAASKLYIATALLHETIHAYMLSVVDDYNTYPTNAPFREFPELFKIYVSKINPLNTALTAQHEDMANKYVDAIASALEEYQTSTTGIPSSLADKQVFLDMAWSGLRGTDIYNKKSQEGIINDARIFARIGAEQSGNYHQGVYPAGNPCN